VSQSLFHQVIIPTAPILYITILPIVMKGVVQIFIGEGINIMG